jgi:GNAT superfamily N-acetyltransferase
MKSGKRVSEKVSIKPFYRIVKVQKSDSAKVVAFLKAMRKELFPNLVQDCLPLDIQHFNSYYMDQKDSGLYAAMTEDGIVLGTIGFLPYDDRFKQLSPLYNQTKTTEVVRCYIDPNYRRLGIGTALYTTVLNNIRTAGYQKVYLHTHLFLPGGASFWKSQGFVERLAENDPDWQTVHMDYHL